jgi:hypothetical protein
MAIIEQGHGLQQRGAGHEVPQHPSAGGEEQQPVAGVQVEVKRPILLKLEQNSAVALHDRLRQSCGPG